nr:RluA family pseudouridine synthase [uncultured Eubacterium sp.]
MQEIIIGKNEVGQRFDKFLFKFFKEAPGSFIYKMLRKKNIVLNNKKANGKEKLNINDSVKIYMTDDTIDKFTGKGNSSALTLPHFSLDVVYEDENVIIVNKPSGILSQKAQKDDISINEYIISYLVETKSLSATQLKTFKPGVCNRLDRNTSGLIIAGKSLIGLQTMSEIIKKRSMDKFYLTLVSGYLDKTTTIKGYLKKDKKTNKVTISNKETPDGKYIETKYEPIGFGENLTLLKVKLVTGRAHQIRAHLSSIGHGIIGDYKYGNKKINDIYKEKYGLKDQLLHSWIMSFPEIKGALCDLSQQTIKAAVPEIFEKIIDENIQTPTEV